MTEPVVQVIIPFRDRGIDPRRTANMDVVMQWWWAWGYTPKVVSDGGSGDQQFNRHKAYNTAIEENPYAEVFIFSEADMLVPPHQIFEAVMRAADTHSLVVPFTQYRYLSDETTEAVRDFTSHGPSRAVAMWMQQLTVFGAPTERIMDNGRSIGAINVVSRNALNVTGGYTEATEGNWYDDNIINEGWAAITGQPTEFIDGPAVHLYHLPGHTGDHLTAEDRAATERNKGLLTLMRYAITTGDRQAVKALMEVRR